MIRLTKIQKNALIQELGELSKFSKRAQELLLLIGSRTAVHNQSTKDAMMLASTTRNKLLLADKEQQKLSQTTVGFFGLSVGSHAAITWMMLSRAVKIKIADPDVISPSNLNRLRLGWSAVGKQKLEMTKKHLLDINPAAIVDTLDHTSPKQMEAFCRATPRLDCIVDEIDDLEGKILLRKIARDLAIPLVSAVDVGDNVLIDIERYDTQPNTKFFLGRIPDIEQINFAQLTPTHRARLIISLVGLEHNSSTMLTSLLAIGREIGTWPQLGSTATIAGGIVATTIKRIVLGERVKSGRYVFDMDALFGKAPLQSERKTLARLKKNIRKKFDI